MPAKMIRKLSDIPTLEDIQGVHPVIRSYIHRTPVLTSVSLNAISGANLYFKCENFQKVGAFKMRGACSAILSLSEDEKLYGVATHSSGNHAQALALAANMMDIPAYIVMPENAPLIKRKATEGYGATIIPCKPTLESRETTLQQVVNETGATFIHPYNNYNIIAGQATAAKELIEDVDDNLDVMIAPIGGGGLMSGTALICHYLMMGMEVIGAEPKAVDDAWRSMKKGIIVQNTTTDTIADGLKTNLGEKTFDIIQKYVDDIITVEEKEIIQAMRIIWERLKIVVEPSGAVPFAALLKDRQRFKNKKVGMIFSGGNVDLDNLPFKNDT